MHPDFLVVGAGVAGLRAAIELAQAGEVLVIAKDTLRESSSEYAQGGIAVALSDDDEVDLHEQDTIAAGDGLCDRSAVHALVEEGPAAIEQLIDWGAEFDREGLRLSFTQEGAHSRRRILHAHGDSTGQEIARTLYRKVCSLSNVRFQSYAAITDLVLDAGVVRGAVVYDEKARESHPILARAVLLATGGLGRVYLETTNPDVATGDGVAIAWRAGAEIGDIEFVQFHPTVLHVEGAPRFLLSEALRGEGGCLINADGERFMHRYHRLEELAPRDVVSRAIVAELRLTGARDVFLDLTRLRNDGGDFLRSRFPRIYETCLRYGIDLAKQPAPVHPAAHYAMGGVYTDLDGRASLPGLYAAGEAACTGVHGANRLASNSLLEGVVFGARAGRAMRSSPNCAEPGKVKLPRPLFPCTTEDRVRRLAWQKCGIIRAGEQLEEACKELETDRQAENPEAGLADYCLRSIHAVALLIARAALARRESRGAHFRTAYPGKETAFEKHSVITGNEVGFR